jgi:F-type H+-transporting ATPase subunit delta
MRSLNKIARSYAEALAEASEAQNVLAAAGEDLRGFAALIEESEDLRTVFASPTVSPDDKAKVLDEMLLRARPIPLVSNLLRVMQRNYRLHLVGETSRAFEEELDKRSGSVAAHVTSAAALTDSERSALESQLTALTGRKVKLSFETDEELIGGVVTRIGSVIYDGSVRTQLDTIRRRLAKQA